MEPIARIYRDDFFREDGSIILQRDIFTNKISNIKQETVERDIHEYNDDFGNAMLQAAADLFKDEAYRKAAYKFAQWLADHQEPDGGFLNKKAEVHSAAPMAMMYFDELGTFSWPDWKCGEQRRDVRSYAYLRVCFDCVVEPEEQGKRYLARK